MIADVWTLVVRKARTRMTRDEVIRHEPVAERSDPRDEVSHYAYRPPADLPTGFRLAAIRAATPRLPFPALGVNGDLPPGTDLVTQHGRTFARVDDVLIGPLPWAREGH